MNDSSTPPKIPLTSMDVADEKRRQLKQLFPEAFTEARDPKTGELKHTVDWEKLKASLGDVLDKEGERFGLTWPGKSGLLKIIQQPSVGTLKPCREESVNFDESENLFIEGDNLEVLKLLQKSYFGKVKMIYIDPPYNTGNEFVYPDNFTESLETYLQYTGMVDAQGRKFSTNAATEGRFHSKWLNMMYPRLFLARNLLKEDGVIFISIDDNEIGNLRSVFDELFGEENFIGNIVWSRKRGKDNSAKFLSRNHEYLIVYGKSIVECRFLRLEMPDETRKAYSNPDNDSRGPYRLLGVWARGGQGGSYYGFETKEGLELAPRNWLVGQNTMRQLDAEGKLKINGDKVYRKLFLDEYKGDIPETIWLDASNAANAADEIKKILGTQVFDTVKPLPYLSKMLRCGVGEDDIVLDFFSGSCTTAHAVLDLNKKDRGNRKFIMVQLPEPCDEDSEAYKAGYRTIAGIGKERIRRVISKIEKQQDGELDLDAGTKKQDLGFRVFKLTPSNFKTWQGDETDPDKIREQLEFHVNHINPQATPEDILYELLLKAGFPLTTAVEQIDIGDKTAYSVADGALIICLDDNLTKEAIRAIADRKPDQAICLDAAFHENDQLKTNAVQIMESAEVQFRTV